ncbi:hypothetical protein ACIPJK_38435 [Streptomyces roseus]|uniref:hypothetical protein n=1 Tax=Streptomyces roseus TaxID=66430 RepID=UPI00382C4C48
MPAGVGARWCFVVAATGSHRTPAQASAASPELEARIDGRGLEAATPPTPIKEPARLCFHLRPGSYDTAGFTEVLEQMKVLGLVKHLTGGPAVGILAEAAYQGLGAQTGGCVGTPPHRKFKKNPPDWYEESYER